MGYTFQWGVAFAHLPELLAGAWVTLHLTFLSYWLGLAIAIAAAIGQVYGGKLLSRIISVYVVAMTNTPGLVTAYFIVYGLPQFGILLSPYQSILLNLALKTGGFLTETIRGGVISVRRTELDAAEAMGFSLLQTARYVIVPHVAKTLYAPLSNFYIWIILASSTAAIFGVEELTGRAYNIAASTYRSIEIFSITAGLYVLLTIAASTVLALFGRWCFHVKARIF